MARDDPPPFELEGYKKGTTLEGMLFPATYDVLPEEGDRERSSCEDQLEAFDANFAKVDMTRARAANLTEYDVVIIASMIDREALVPAERAVVAAVIWNRLRKDMLLQIDATIQYALGKTKPLLTYDDLKIDSPYNTYKHAGLPPTPISNPGLAALQAAAEPHGRQVPLLRRAQRRHRPSLLLDHLRAVPRRQGEGRRRTASSLGALPAPAGRGQEPAARGQSSSTPAALPRRAKGAPLVSGTTHVIGIIGDPVSHSLSPRLHNAAFAALGLDYVYVPLPVRAADVGAAVQGLAALGFRGANVTVPHKGAVDPVPRRALRRRPSRRGGEHHRRGRRPACAGTTPTWKGSAERSSPSPAIRCAANRRWCFGAGGAARAAALALARLGCPLTIVNRTPAAAERLAALITAGVPGASCEWLALSALTERRRARASESSSTRPHSAWPARVKSLPCSPITLRRGKSYSMRYTLPRRPTSSRRRRPVELPSSTA